MSRISGSSSKSTSRRRRPGVAKTRLAKAKEAEKVSHKKGWHESMQAAAASYDRVWEPKKGWIDYMSRESVDTVQEMADSQVKTEKLHIPRHIAKAPNRQRSSSHATGQRISDDEIGTAFEVSLEQGNHKATIVSRNAAKAMANFSKESGTTTSTIAKAVNSRNATRGILVHVKRNQKSKTPLGSSSDPCWSHSPRRSGDDPTRPILLEQSSVFEEGRDAAAFGSPSRKKLPEEAKSHLEKKEQNKPHERQAYPLRKVKPAGPENTPVPPRISRIILPPPTIDARRRNTHPVSPPRARGTEQSADYQSLLPPPLHSSQWVKSMKRAVATLANGHPWDPKHGFPNLDSCDVGSLQPSVRSNQPVTRAARQRHNPHPEQAMHSSPAYALEVMIAERKKDDPPGRKESKDCSLRAVAANLYEAAQPTTHPQGIQSYQVRGVDGKESSIQEHTEVMVSSPASWTSKARGTLGISALNFEDDDDYLLGAPVVVTPDTASEKIVSPDEIEFSPYAKHNSAQYGRPVVSPEGQDNSNYEISMMNSRPLNVDEFDKLSVASSEATEASNGWKSEMFDIDTFLRGSMSSRKHRERDPREHDKSKGDKWKKEVAQVGASEQLENKPGVKYLEAADPSPLGDRGRGTMIETTVNDPRILCSPIDFVQGNVQEKTVERPGILKIYARQIPWEIATDDTSLLSTPSSVTAGWKSFLNKKVEKESAAAAWLHQQEEKAQTLNKEQKIKKTVSFASDSILSDSLLDSIFDFSTSYVDPTGSPSRCQSSAVKPYQPNPLKSNRWTKSSARPASPQDCERISSSSCCHHSATETRQPLLEEEKDPLEHGETRPAVPFDLPPQRIHQRSSGELPTMSPLTSHNEEKESDGQDDYRPSFLQEVGRRLAECRPPAAHEAELGRPASYHQHSLNDSIEAALAHQWCLQASARVEEMMDFLKSKRFSSCAAIRSDDNNNKLHPRNAETDAIGVDNNIEISELEGSDGDAHELARARVEAIIETLYYASK